MTSRPPTPLWRAFVGPGAIVVVGVALTVLVLQRPGIAATMTDRSVLGYVAAALPALLLPVALIWCWWSGTTAWRMATDVVVVRAGGRAPALAYALRGPGGRAAFSSTFGVLIGVVATALGLPLWSEQSRDLLIGVCAQGLAWIMAGSAVLVLCTAVALLAKSSAAGAGAALAVASLLLLLPPLSVWLPWTGAEAILGFLRDLSADPPSPSAVIAGAAFLILGVVSALACAGADRVDVASRRGATS